MKDATGGKECIRHYIFSLGVQRKGRTGVESEPCLSISSGKEDKGGAARKEGTGVKKTKKVKKGLDKTASCGLAKHREQKGRGKM